MARKKPFIVLAVLAVLAVLYVFNMAYFSIKPDFFSVEKKAEAQQGLLFSTTLQQLLEHELDGSGGWIPNDTIISPTWALDNRPNFQLGVLEVVRYSSRVLRDNLSRQRSTDKIDPDCDGAFTSFSNDPRKWIMPSAEGKYKQGIRSISEYARRLEYGTSSFYPRSDNLIQLLEQYASLLGGVNTRLLNASRAQTSFSADDNSPAKVAWTEIDDNFYYAQGVGYALYHMFQALQIEFEAVLRDKNAALIVSEIIISLREGYFEPVLVTNGSKNGVFANHSSNLRVFLDDARQKTNSLIRMLDQG